MNDIEPFFKFLIPFFRILLSQNCHFKLPILLKGTLQYELDYCESLKSITISEEIVGELLEQFKMFGLAQHNLDVQRRMLFVVCQILLDRFKEVITTNNLNIIKFYY